MKLMYIILKIISYTENKISKMYKNVNNVKQTPQNQNFTFKSYKF